MKHHTNDSHDFGLFTNEGEEGEEHSHYGFPLPVILWDDGLHVFMSSSFHHGHEVVESNGKYYVLDYHDGRIYSADKEGNVLSEPIKDEDGNIVEMERIAPLDFSITKNVLSTMLIGLLIVLLV